MRSTFETRFGADFSNVRVRTGPAADEAAKSVGAEAYTLGSEIVFARGQYAPETVAGKQLLAHELTHVVQQRRGQSDDVVRRRIPKSPSSSESVTGFDASTIEEKIARTIEDEVAAYNNLEINVDPARANTGESGAGAGGSGGGIPGQDRTIEEEQGDAIEPTLNVFMPWTAPRLDSSSGSGDQENPIVTVEATYFINTDERFRTHRQRGVVDGRRQFTGDSQNVKENVAEEADVQFRSTLDNTYEQGRAVELGKASPSVLEAFIQQAWDMGVIHDYASAHSIPDVEGTPDLSNSVHARKAVQDYVNKVGIGVDCSGFVTHLITEARRKIEHTEDTTLPAGERADEGEIRLANRNASQFAADGNPIDRPGDLRPGDVWVKSDQAHIVMISEVPGATEAGYEFKTVESGPSGGVTLANTSDEGIKEETYTAESADEFGDDPTIQGHIDDGAGGDGFYRMDELKF